MVMRELFLSVDTKSNACDYMFVKVCRVSRSYKSIKAKNKERKPSFVFTNTSTRSNRDNCTFCLKNLRS